MRQVSELKKTLLRNGMKVAAFLAVFVLVFSPLTQFFEVPFAQAASCPEGTTQGQQHLIDWSGVGYFDCVNSNNTVVGRYYPYQGAGGTYKADGDTLINGVASFLAFPIYLFTAGLGGAAATLGSYLFNVSIYFSLNSTAYALGFITQGWEVARDLANMFFILILIYLAVTIVLQADTSKTMQTLVRVLAIALVINFSFFVTRVVIDAGNFTAVQFYNNITAEKPDGTTVTQHITPGGNVAKDLSASIMNAVGVSSIIGSKAFDEFQKNNSGSVTGGFGEFIVLVVIYVCLGVAYFILAAIFAATAIKFFIRIAVLWLTIVASPLAFLAYTVPAFQEQFKKWRDTLIQHAFFPVTFLFIYWLISLFAPDLALKDAFTAYNSSIQGADASGLWAMIELIGNVFVRLAFLVIMIYLGLSAADKVGVMGAQWANGVGGLVGRNTFGRLGLAIGRNPALANTSVGRGVLRVAGAMSRGSYDLRSFPGVSGVRGSLGLKDTATGKGGIVESMKKRDHDREHEVDAMAKSLTIDAITLQKNYESSGEGRQAYKAAYDERKKANQALATAQRAGDKEAIGAATARLASVAKVINDLDNYGEHNIKQYNKDVKAALAAGISSRHLGNLLLGPSRSSLKAAEHLSHGKSSEQSALDALEKWMKEKEKATAPKEEKPKPIVTSTPAAGATAQKAAETHKEDHGHDGHEH